MKIYIEEYSQSNRTLTLALCLANFGAISIEEPFFMLPALEANFQQLTIASLESELELQRIEDGEQYPDYSGNMIEIEEDYILELIDFGAGGKICLAGINDPQEPHPFRYSKILLRYRPPDALSPIGELPPSWQSQPLNPGWGYPPGVSEAWGYPSLGGDYWHCIEGEIWNGAPFPHYRCFLRGEWSWLLTQQEAESGDIWDCFRWSSPADGGPWFSGIPQLISRGINDSWADSSAEIVARRGGMFDVRGTAIHWLHDHLGWTWGTDFRARDYPSDIYLDIMGSDQAGSNTKLKREGAVTGGGVIPAIFVGMGRELFSGVVPGMQWRKKKR